MVNSVTLIGRVGKDPELKNLPSGMAVVKFSLATTNYKNETQWHSITAFDRVADVIGKYVTKGNLVYVNGNISYNNFEKDGVKRTFTEIIVNEFKFLEKKQTEESEPF